MMNEITIIKPDDFHVHLRDNEYLHTTVNHTAQRFARALVMPNLTPPVTTVEAASSYYQRILAAAPKNSNFTPLMSLYLTDTMPPDTISEAKKSGIVHACKLYPAGATTNSDAGVTDIKKIYPVLEAMQAEEMLLLIHGEVTDPAIDFFDREQVFIDTILKPLVADFPKLKLVLEHITTKNAVDFITEASENVAATITAHHLLLNRNDLFLGGLRPHNYCLPIAKRAHHQQALIEAATGNNARFFFGSDSAPHSVHNKESECGCAGIYTSHAAIELCAEVFDSNNALENLEDFCSKRGADFYKIPQNTDTITLKRQSWQAPETYDFGSEKLKPFRAKQSINWTLETP